MGLDDVKEEIKQDRSREMIDALKMTIASCIRIKESSNNLYGNLNAILGERYELTTKDGHTRVIEGRVNNGRNNTIGYESAFAGSAYIGQPFSEVSRNMACHFKMYCLVNGVSDREMLSMTKGEPSAELAGRLRALKSDFFHMIADKDMQAIENFYVGILEYTEKKLPVLMKCDDLRSIPAAEEELILLKDKESYLMQTLNLHDKMRVKDEQKTLVANINSKLNAKGKTYTLQSANSVLDCFDGFSKALDTHPSPEYGDWNDMQQLGTLLSISNRNELPIFQNALGMVRAVRELKSESIEKNTDYTATFYGKNENAANAVYYSFYSDISIFNEEMETFSLYSSDQLVLADRLDKRFSSLKELDPEDEIGMLSLSVRAIRNLEENIRADRDRTSLSAYKELKILYKNVDKLSKSILESEDDEYSDDEYALAVECAGLAKSGLRNPAFANLNPDVGALAGLSIAVHSEVTDLEHAFDTILQEPFTHTDKNGTVRNIAGRFNDREKNTLGIQEYFGGPEYVGKPFHEVGREMNCHFKMYCITKGLSDEELSELAACGNSKPISTELAGKLRDLKSGFLDMVINKDMDKIAEMYADIAGHVNNDRDRFMQLTTYDPQSIGRSRELLYKYSGSMSWYLQSTRYSANGATDEQKELGRLIDAKFAERGYSFSFGQLAPPLLTVETIQQVPSLRPEDIHDPVKTAPGGTVHHVVNQYSGYIDHMHDAYRRHQQQKPGENWLQSYDPNMDSVATVSYYLTMETDEQRLESALDHSRKMGSVQQQADSAELSVYKNMKPEDMRAFLYEEMRRSGAALRSNVSEVDTEALVSFIAASQQLRSMSFSGGQGEKSYEQTFADIDKDLVTRVYSGLDNDERMALLSSEVNSSEFIAFEQNCEYEMDLQEHAQAYSVEEDRAYAVFHASPAKKVYVEQQKTLGKLLTDPGSFGKNTRSDMLLDKFKGILSKMIAAKQIESYILSNYGSLSENQISMLTSDAAIEARTERILESELLEKTAMKLNASPKEMSNLAIGAEPWFYKDEIAMSAPSERSENSIAGLARQFSEDASIESLNCTLNEVYPKENYKTALKEYVAVHEKWKSIKNNPDARGTAACMRSLIDISQKYGNFDCIALMCGARTYSVLTAAKTFIEKGAPEVKIKDLNALMDIYAAGKEANDRLKAQGVKVNKGVPENYKTGWSFTKKSYQAGIEQELNTARIEKSSSVKLL